MGNILVVGEHRDSKLVKATLSVVAFAQQVKAIQGGDIIGLVLGSGARSAADALAASGVDKVVYVDDGCFENYQAETYAAATVAMAESLGADVIAAAASLQGKDFLPRAASALGAGMAADITAVFEDGGEVRFKRPMWAGNIIAITAIDSPVKVVSVRATAFDPPAAGAAVGVEEQAASYPTDLTTFVAFETVKSERPDLADASVIAAGGRGMKTAENFKLLEDLADYFGGAVGASRAAVDSGMCAFDLQVGQTGKIVAPDLYFAVAISGAIQHVAGMKASKVIVAINKDPEAPIFQVSDYGLVADAFKVLPELNEKIAAIKGA